MNEDDHQSSDNVSVMSNRCVMTTEALRSLREMDSAIVESINKAKKSGTPQGMIVAILHGHALAQTMDLLKTE